MWAMFCHLAALVGGVVGPLIVWLARRNQYPFVDEQGREALNFQITMLIYLAAAILLTFVAFLLIPCLGIPLVLLLALTNLLLTVVAAVKANDGHHYRYPRYLIIRFIK